MKSICSPRERILVRETDPVVVARLQQELKVPSGIASILVGRNLCTYEQCKTFFRPDISQFHDPFLFEHMQRAVVRIQDAISNGEKIAVYGDYDVDGITSTALLLKVLKRLGANCEYFLPNRLIDGYGISECGIRQIASSNAKLVISVDCGITANYETAVAAQLGMDMIITDHHEPKESLPDAFAILNPKVNNCAYPDKNLAGVGVALKLCQALAKYSGKDEQLWLPFLDIVALGTAADIVPLLGENRIIARYGFQLLNNTSHAGLKALIDLQGLTGKKISTSEVVFQLAPSINAGGRLGDAKKGVELLLTDDPQIAAQTAMQLRETNQERRALDNAVAEEAVSWVENNSSPDRDFVLVLGRESWHVGVIGIVASKMVDKFHRPSILFSIGPDGLARGSGRSIPGLHLLSVLNECSDILEGFGGHAAAAGMSIKCQNIDIFRERINQVVSKVINADDLVPQVIADAEINLSQLSPKFFRIINEMAPFGPGNMRPVFFCKNLKQKYSPRVVGQNHLKMMVIGDGVSMDAIGFNFADRYDEICRASSINLAFSLDENEWNGRINLQMKVKGVSL
ncbi:MAG TPA: single-stranded-DNA-specific exonuclease RecJ [Chitinispirillaceae bacterium]|nr:single-stranded-DNA-specific exonuclease RecJ [Chitinispirillaceae bacterium]